MVNEVEVWAKATAAVEVKASEADTALEAAEKVLEVLVKDVQAEAWEA